MAGINASKEPKFEIKLINPAKRANISQRGIPIMAKPIAVKTKTTNMENNFPLSQLRSCPPIVHNTSFAFFDLLPV